MAPWIEQSSRWQRLIIFTPRTSTWLLAWAILPFSTCPTLDRMSLPKRRHWGWSSRIRQRWTVTPSYSFLGSVQQTLAPGVSHLQLARWRLCCTSHLLKNAEKSFLVIEINTWSSTIRTCVPQVTTRLRATEIQAVLFSSYSTTTKQCIFLAWYRGERTRARWTSLMFSPNCTTIALWFIT